MGSDRSHACRSRGSTLIQLAQVVPDLPTFAVDDGFTYRVPNTMSLEVGAVVRIPLGGRRVRGFVVGMRRGDSDSVPSRLKDVAARSGDLPVFDERMLETLRWAAIHYVAPLATVLGRTAPPNVPRGTATTRPVAVPGGPPEVLPDVVAAAEAGRHHRVTAWVGGGPWAERVRDLVTPVAAAGRSAIVAVPTAIEAEHMAAALRTQLGSGALLVGASLPARSITAAWATASRRPGTVIIGTRDVALWHVADLSLAVIVGDGRRAMKSPQSPTIHVRDVLRRRAAVERFPLVVAGPVPTIETLSGGAAIEQLPGRAWRLIEVVDRREDQDPGALITDRVRTAMRTVAGRGGRVFCLVHRRGYAPAFRCVSCGRVRRCESCGAAVDRGGSCRRCGATAGSCPHCSGTRFAPLGAGVGRVVDDLARSLGDAVGAPDAGKPVIVGTERDLVEAPLLDLAVVVDADAWLLAPHYRAEEDALRLIARLAGRVAPGSGKRAMVQTALPDHRVLAAARSGRAIDLLRTIGAERASSGFPPAGELLALDARDAPARADGDLRAIVGDGADVLGPGASGDDQRWLIQAHRLDDVRIRLRGLVQQWRDAGIRVRVDADPVDL